MIYADCKGACCTDGKVVLAKRISIFLSVFFHALMCLHWTNRSNTLIVLFFLIIEHKRIRALMLHFYILMVKKNTYLMITLNTENVNIRIRYLKSIRCMQECSIFYENSLQPIGDYL